MSQRQYLTSQQLADHLGLHLNTIYQKAALNLIPHYRIGRKLLFDEAEIAVWVATQTRRFDGTGPQAA